MGVPTVIQLLASSAEANFKVEQPLERDSIYFVPIYSADGLPLRFKLSRPGCTWEHLPKVHRSVFVSSSAGEGQDSKSVQKLMMDLVVCDPLVAKAVADLEAQIVESVKTQATQWSNWGGGASSLLDTAATPLCPRQMVCGQEETLMQINLRPWDKAPPRILLGHMKNGSTSFSDEGDVTDIRSGSRVIPIIHVTGIRCQSTCIGILTKVTDMVVYNQEDDADSL